MPVLNNLTLVCYDHPIIIRHLEGDKGVCGLAAVVIGRRLYVGYYFEMIIQWDPCNQDTLGQSFRVLIIGVSLFQGLCTLD